MGKISSFVSICTSLLTLLKMTEQMADSPSLSSDSNFDGENAVMMSPKCTLLKLILTVLMLLEGTCSRNRSSVRR